MSFVELYNRASETIRLLNSYKDGELREMLDAYERGELTNPPGIDDPGLDSGSGSGSGSGTGPAPELDPTAAKRLDEVLTRTERAVEAVEFPARRVGPTTPTGEYHSADKWGIHFTTERPLHLGRTTIDAQRAGSFTVTLAKYDGKNAYEPLEKTELTVGAGINRIALDLHVPEAGEYILTREGSFSLRRAQWPHWRLAGRDGIAFIGGSKPGDFQKPNDFWYYFFDLSIAAHKGAHLPDPEANAATESGGST